MNRAEKRFPSSIGKNPKWRCCHETQRSTVSPINTTLVWLSTAMGSHWLAEKENEIPSLAFCSWFQYQKTSNRLVLDYSIFHLVVNCGTNDGEAVLIVGAWLGLVMSPACKSL